MAVELGEVNKGYRAFLYGTATDLPCRGVFLSNQRREDVGTAAGSRALMTAAGSQSGVIGQHNGQRKHLTR